MNRRSFIEKSAIAGALWSLPERSIAGNIAKETTYHGFTINDKNVIRFPEPEGKRSPFGWEYFIIPASGEGVSLEFPDVAENNRGRVYLRLLIALEILDKRELVLSFHRSGKVLGTYPIWYANSLQLFEFELNVNCRELKKEGLRIQVKNGTEPVYCYSYSTQKPGSHLFIDSGVTSVREQYFSKLFSLWSVHPFGWMSGCVSDGLYELAISGKFPQAEGVLKRHLDLFLPDNKNLKYEWYDSAIKDNVFHNQEGGLPFAAIARRRADHPSLKLFTDFCETRIQNGKTKVDFLTTEGTYHLAYPLMTVAEVKGNDTWNEIALIEIADRIQFLTTADTVHQGAAKNGQRIQFSNWSRGYAWFLLGLVRSFNVIKKSSSFKNDSRLKLMRETFEYYGNMALKNQRQDGSWGAYIDIPETAFDASGTAGIASALMYGSRIGWNVRFSELDKELVKNRLEKNLMSDGFLKGSCQTNRGGDELQMGSFRVVSQYAMGLMAHLYTTA